MAEVASSSELKAVPHHIPMDSQLRALLLALAPFVPVTQARTVAEPIIATVALMADSGLPCFSRGHPVANLRKRFHLEMSDAQVSGARTKVKMSVMGRSHRVGKEV